MRRLPTTPPTGLLRLAGASCGYFVSFGGAIVAGLAGSKARPATAAGAPVAVDAAIVLAADVSRSIDDDEFALERRGYADAIQSQQLLDAISTGPHGAIALAYVEWAGDGEEKVVVDWAVIRNPADARAFAGAMSVGAALLSRPDRDRHGDRFLLRAVRRERHFETSRRVIDVSGDGTSNQGRLVTEARDAAVGAGAVINGLAIFNKKAAAMGGYLAMHTNPPGGLAHYYRENVIGGSGRFRGADRRFPDFRRRDDAQARQRDF